MIKMRDLLKEEVKGKYLYHLMNFEKMKFVIETNSLKSWNFFNGISTTRNPNMNSYTGEGSMVVFKLKLDWNKLDKEFGTESFNYKSSTGITFEEDEELIKTTKIPNIKNYIIEIVVLKDKLKKLKSYFDPNDEWDKKTWIVNEWVLKNLNKIGKVVYK